MDSATTKSLPSSLSEQSTSQDKTGPGPVPVWVLADSAPGHRNQALAVAEALGAPFITKPLVYGSRARIPNVLLGSGLSHLAEAPKQSIAPPWPKLVIGAGRRTGPVARYIKKQASEPCVLVQLMWPGRPSRDYDLIAVPGHDPYRGDNIVAVPGTPHRLTRAKLDESAQAWFPKLDGAPGPFLAAILGGDSRHGRLSSAVATQFGEAVAGLASRDGLTVLATTSPRSANEAIGAFRDALPGDAIFKPYSPDSETNPYQGFLGLARAVAVTGDSASMCCEATASGQPVFVHAPPVITPPKLKRLIASLEQGRWAAILGPDSSLSGLASASPPLNTAGRIADAIRKRVDMAPLLAPADK